MSLNQPQPVPPRWLHGWAVLTVCLTLPLLFLGAEVTTKDVGMADPIGYRHPWVILQNFSEANLGLRIEYSHRIAGFVVGTCAILLVVGLFLFEPRRWVRWVGVLALLLICTQGLLGIFRVDYNALHGRTFAMIHGCFAQLVIASLVSVALFTSRSWLNDRSDVPASPQLRRWSLLTMLLIYGQLVLGGMVRHKDFLLGSRLHLIGAFVVLAAVLWLVKLLLESERRESLAFSTKLLLGLIGFQILIGIESWMFRANTFYDPQAVLSPYKDLVRSGHYVVGTLIFAASVVVALKANRQTITLENPAPARKQQWEGVA